MRLGIGDEVAAKADDEEGGYVRGEFGTIVKDEFLPEGWLSVAFDCGPRDVEVIHLDLLKRAGEALRDLIDFEAVIDLGGGRWVNGFGLSEEKALAKARGNENNGISHPGPVPAQASGKGWGFKMY